MRFGYLVPESTLYATLEAAYFVPKDRLDAEPFISGDDSEVIR